MSEKNINTEGKKYKTWCDRCEEQVMFNADGTCTNCSTLHWSRRPENNKSEPATPTAQWQKEAEDMSLEQLQGMVIGAEWVYSYYQKLKDRLNAEHTAHMEQVQREMEKWIEDWKEFTIGCDLSISQASEAIHLETRLRSITQTKTDKG